MKRPLYNSHARWCIINAPGTLRAACLNLSLAFKYLKREIDREIKKLLKRK